MINVEITPKFVDVVVTGDLAEADLDPLFSALNTSARRGVPFAVVTDTTDMKSAPRAVLKTFADRLKRMPWPPLRWMDQSGRRAEARRSRLCLPARRGTWDKNRPARLPSVARRN